MTHEILGEIKLGEAPFDGVANIRYESRDIKVGISRDDQSLEVSIILAVDVVQRLAELDKLAKRAAAADLRETYNNGWNDYDEVQDDGSLKSVCNPQLSEDEFEAKLSLNAINVSGAQVVEFFYADENMFWGHTVMVISFSGIDFSDAHAELFGQRSEFELKTNGQCVRNLRVLYGLQFIKPLILLTVYDFTGQTFPGDIYVCGL
jgi:hypothetical protein